MKSSCTNLLICLILCMLCFLHGNSQTTVNQDALLSILQKQVKQQYDAFPPKTNPVYLLSYRVEETENHLLSSSLGSPTERTNEKNRILTVQVRMGSPKLDNFHPLREDVSDLFTQSRTIYLPTDNNEQAINQVIARETRTVYLEALKRYKKVLTNVAVKVTAQDTADDYILMPPTVYYEPPVNISDLNYDDWQQKINRCTEVFTDAEHLIDGSATIQYYTTRKYLVNSEGTSIVENNTYAYLYLTATAQADDGMNLPLLKSYFAQNPNDFPITEQLISDATTMKNKLRDLWEAPVADAFVGPVIFSNQAAGVFFHEILGHHLEGTSFRDEEDGQTLRDKIGEQILPNDFTVTFDPTLKFENDNPLSGFYHYDDEGVLGEKVIAVNKGILQNFLMTRTPLDGIYKSNGHARAEASYQPVSRQSNLLVTVDNPHTDTELRQMLKQQAKAQGKEYGYLIQSVQSGFAMTGRSYPNAFNINPLEVYRIYVDGRPDELVRGVNLVGTPLSVLAQVMAGGNETDCFSGICGASSGDVPTHCCSPAILVRQLETQRQTKSQSRPPLLERPYNNSIPNSGNFAEVAFKAMKDEMTIDLQNLKLESMLPPYNISYLMTDAHIYSVESMLGSTVMMTDFPYRNFGTRILVGSDEKNNENFIDENSLINTTTTNLPLPLDNNYNTIRRSLWRATDNAYKQAASNYYNKQDALKQQNLPKEIVDLDDRSDIVCTPYLNDKIYDKLTLPQLQNIACELSGLFADGDSLINSGVSIYAYQANAYFMASDKIQYAQPFSLFCIHIFAEAIAVDGEPLMDCTNLFFRDIKDIPTMDILRGKVQTMMSNLLALRKAPKITESYGGPVLISDEAVPQLFCNAFLESTPNLIASRQPISANPEALHWYARYFPTDNILENWIDKKVINSNLTIRALDGTYQFSGIPLIGSYTVDAEGLKVDEAKDIIKNGILLTLLSNRTPTVKIPYSNGHARLALSNNFLATSRGAGVLSLYCRNRTSEEKLKRKLLSEARSDGYHYAYIIRKMADRNMNDVPNFKSYISDNQSYKPIYVYRVDVATGKETLVRMSELDNFNFKNFKQLETSSKTMQAYNTLVEGEKKTYGTRTFPLSGVPCSFIVPNSLLFNELEINPDNNISLEPLPEH